MTIMDLLFYDHCSDVQKMSETAKALYHRWNELVDDPHTTLKEELDWTTNELRNSLRSIEWDLEDLEETINILWSLVHFTVISSSCLSSVLILTPKCLSDVSTVPKLIELVKQEEPTTVAGMK